MPGKEHLLLKFIRERGEKEKQKERNRKKVINQEKIKKFYN